MALGLRRLFAGAVLVQRSCARILVKNLDVEDVTTPVSRLELEVELEGKNGKKRDAERVQ